MKVHSAKILGMMLFFAGLVLCGAGLWILLSSAQYRAAAKVALGYVSPDEKSRPGIIGDPYYDPFFIVNADTEIRTKVLTNVIATLKLDASQTARMLSSRVAITPETPERKIGTVWIIQVTDENPDKAMQLANAIAKSYADYGVALEKLQTAAGLQTLQKEYTNEEIQILTLQTNLDEKRKLVELHKLVGTKIEALKTDLQSSQYSTVRIVSLAVMPTMPSGPNWFLGKALLVTGFLFVVSAFFCWWRSFSRPF
ncbi:MAG TPA: hypothetical protein VHG89_13480 [Verrucomicrobiae bacterium]|nr:hypothetical protein [Verrucomicrobiae bacterium]